MFKRFKAAGRIFLASGLATLSFASQAIVCNTDQLLADWSVQFPYVTSTPVSGLSSTIRFSILSPSGSYFIASAGLQPITLACDTTSGVLRGYVQGDYYIVTVDPNNAMLQVDRMIGGQYWARSYYAKTRAASLTLGEELVAVSVVIGGVYFSSISDPSINRADYVTTNGGMIPTTLATLQQLQAERVGKTTAGLRPFTIQTYVEK